LYFYYRFNVITELPTNKQLKFVAYNKASIIHPNMQTPATTDSAITASI